MADDEFDYDGDFFEDGDNYYYVEDTYALADDLAENVIPDPGGFYDGQEEWDDMSRFEYWNDIDYDSDGYNDLSKRRTNKSTAPKTNENSTSRKRKASAEAEKITKRPKLSRNQSTLLVDLPPVLFMSPIIERQEPIADITRMETYSIFPDWRERFKNIKSVANVIPQAKPPNIEDMEMESDDEIIEDESDGEMDVSAPLDALTLSLEKNLASMGLDTTRIDQSKLLLLAQKIMSQSEDAEQLMEEIIEGIHSGEEQTGKDPFAEWITGKTDNTRNGQHEEKESVPKRPNEDSMEVQDPIYDQSRLADGTPVPNTTETVATAGKKRKLESPDSSTKKRRNVSKRIPT